MSSSFENPLKKKLGSEFFRKITGASGVYFMLDRHGDILYIGKAKNLRNRITSYSQLKPGSAPERSLQMIAGVDSIQWLECATEQDALVRENELLHAIRPPFNIAHTEPANYLFIGVKEGRQRGNSYFNQEIVRLDFQLSRNSWIQDQGYELYGCFKYRQTIKRGYSALLRLIHASTFRGKRFSCPAQMARRSPPWVYSVDFPKAWRNSLSSFLLGESDQLLHSLMERLLDSEFIPGFVRASIQDDLEMVQIFFDLGPKTSLETRNAHRVSSTHVSQTQMDQWIASGIPLHFRD